MKRFAALAAALLCLLPSVCCAAADKDFYSAYTPRSASSSLFYIDVFCECGVTAAVFNLRYDESMVSYYSVSTVNTAASVRDRVQTGKTTVAFADSSAVSGQLCRLSFKALKTGEVTFILHMEQAADAERKKLPQLGNHILTVKLGKDDIPSSRNTNRKISVSSALLPDSQLGDKSYLGTDEDDSVSPQGGMFDLRRSDSLKWVLIGMGITVLIAALVAIGILIGRKKPVKQEAPPHTVTENETE